MKKTGFALSVALAAVCACGETLESLKSRASALEFTGANGKVLKYRLVEKTPSNGSKVPLLFFFHGAGQRGDDNTAQLGNLPDIVTWLDTNESGFKIVAGQVPSGKLWVDVSWSSLAHTMPTEPSESMGLALELLDEFLADSSIDTNRVYATGLSMGGYGTWDAISRRPEVFAAAIPICGGGDVAQASNIKDIPIWAFHGSKDGSVPVFRSRSMMSALWNAGSDAHYWEYPDAPHDVWSRTYRNSDVLNWLFTQNKATASSGGTGGGDTPVLGPTENNLGDVRLESESFTLQALATGALTDHAETFTIAPGARKGGLDRIVAKGGTGYANVHLDIHEFLREGNAVLDIHAAENLLGKAALGTAATANITCSYGVNAVGSGAAGTTSVPVVPWARGAISSDARDAVWTQLVTYGDNGFRFLDADTEYETISSAQTGVAPTSGANVRVTAAGVVDFAGNCNVNSFSMLSTAASTVYVTNGTMHIASGVLDMSVWNTVTVDGNFDFGNATAYITQCANKTATLKGNIAGRDIVFADNAIDCTTANAPLAVKSTGTFTGDLYINGMASIDTPSFLPSGNRTGNVYANGKFMPNGGTMNGLFGNGILDKRYSGTATLTIGDNDANGDFAGTVTNTVGNLNLTKIGAGTQRFGGTVSIGGDFRVNGGTLLLEGTLSAKSVSVANGASLVVNLPASLAASEEPVKVITAKNSMEGVTFTKGERVASLQLRENGTELWATGHFTGTLISMQ